MPTICHPLHCLARGGLENQLLQLIRLLPDDQFRHVIVTRESAAHAAERPSLRSLGVRHIQLGGPERDGAWSQRLAAVFRQEAVDLVHVRGLAMLPDAVMAAEACGGVVTAFSFHGFEQARPEWSLARRTVYRAAIERCDDRWAVSYAAAEALAEKLGISDECFGVLYNGVDTDRWKPAVDHDRVRAALGLSPEDFVVLSVGNLKPIKGHDVLLEGVARLGEQERGAVVVLVGEDFSGGELQQWADKHICHARVRFVGDCEDVLSWYQAADVFVLPSRFEGHCNALLEALACGLPVIATRTGGNTEVIEDGRTGLLMPVEDPAALTGGLRRLMSDASLREALGRQGRAEACVRFDSAITTARYESRYTRLAAAVGPLELCAD